MFYLNCPDWDKGLGKYLATFKWGNPTAVDLTTALSSTCPDYDTKMLPWLLQPGFPIVTLSVNSTDPLRNTVSASQKPVSHKLDQTLLWFVPLNCRAQLMSADGIPVGAALTFSLAFAGKTSSSYTLPKLQQDGQMWAVEGNYDYSGFFLTNYAQEAQWQLQLNKLKDPNFPAVDARQLSNQVYFLAQAQPSPNVDG